MSTTSETLTAALTVFMPEEADARKRFFNQNRVALQRLKEADPEAHRKVLEAFQGIKSKEREEEQHMADFKKRNPDKCHGSMRQNDNKKEDWHSDIRGQITVPPAILKELLTLHKAGGKPTLRIDVKQHENDKGKWWNVSATTVSGTEVSDWWSNFWDETHPS